MIHHKTDYGSTKLICGSALVAGLAFAFGACGDMEDEPGIDATAVDATTDIDQTADLSRENETYGCRWICLQWANNGSGDCFEWDYRCDPPPTKPAAPSIKEITYNYSLEYFRIKWRDNSTNENHFDMIRRTPDIPGSRSRYTRIPKQNGTGYDVFIDGPLEPGVRYCYQIRAVNDQGYTRSNEKCKTRGVPPNPPKHFQASIVTETSITLTWFDNATNESVFYLWCQKKNGGGKVDEWFQENPGVGWMSHKFNGLSSGTIYVCKIWLEDWYGVQSTGNPYVQVETESHPIPPVTQPDLVASGISLGFDDLGQTKPNKPFTIGYQVCNFGAATTKSWKDGIYLQRHSTGLVEVEQTTTHSIQGNDCYGQTLRYDKGLPAGCYSWSVITNVNSTGNGVDPGLGESNVVNNAGYLLNWCNNM